LNHHLSQISTVWAQLRQAQGGAGGRDPARGEAQEQMLRRYSPAIYRYLLGALRDPDAADELFQEFALRFVRGDFHRADERRGRFRDFLKTALFHLVVDAQRRRKRPPDPRASGDRGPEPAVDAPPDADEAEAERQFLQVWRSELLARAWDGLA